MSDISSSFAAKAQRRARVLLNAPCGSAANRPFSLSVLLLIALAMFSPSAVECQGEASRQLDALVKKWLETRRADLQPKRIKTRGKPKVARWEDVDRTLNDLVQHLDRDYLLIEAKRILAPSAADDSEAEAEVKRALGRYQIAFKEIFAFKEEDVLFPLTNLLLKHVPESSLLGLSIYDKRGEQLGTFAGKFIYERSGGLVEGKTYRLTYFQYTDKNNRNQTTGDDLLLDSYCVRWSEIKDRPAVLLSPDDGQ